MSAVAPLAIGLYVVLIPSLPALPGVGLYNSQRLLALGALLVATLPLLARGVREAWLRTFPALPRAARAGLVLVLGLGCSSATLAAHPRYAFVEVGL